MRTVCIIPARGGSKRIPGKNIRLFHGIPIIMYSIDAAQRARIFDEIYVSTDDSEIERLACKLGVGIFRRSWSDPEGSIGTQDVMARHLLTEPELRDVSMACCLYATAPLLRPHDLISGYGPVLAGAPFSKSVNGDTAEDAGQFYFGWAASFADSYPLLSPRTALMGIDPARVCDINTEDDWQRAEKMYAALHGLETK